MGVGNPPVNRVEYPLCLWRGRRDAHCVLPLSERLRLREEAQAQLDCRGAEQARTLLRPRLGRRYVAESGDDLIADPVEIWGR